MARAAKQMGLDLERASGAASEREGERESKSDSFTLDTLFAVP